ncbi:hypothetical protein DPMN_135268 [Dreissena polymorpha]|uniref:Uncharacterized protein n=1 Tax=Dreissena polymorpha TaxID=45954 RepID=A0A9D4G1H9_DREPO|nr:hypothetical protein DPMN_135268 [Dreissena polymorpha]
MALEKDDGLLQCVIPVCKTENINQFNQRFIRNAKEMLAGKTIDDPCSEKTGLDACTLSVVLD